MKLTCVKLEPTAEVIQKWDKVDRIEQSVLRPEVIFIFFTNGSSISIDYNPKYTYLLDII